ncbi:hypothetical protein PPMP20_19220 [Paraburkholderia phymatum]|uniref:Uncharacterized protein n=1 Tax=Paraburkholderia phymatum (strain DSM 17167 / CIP 108236 / LMG 21445 / STM815) TaxID=391038 RepID=B2JUM5_PARP8|nr:hypothetical protein [Paraburkholderia phymatum]ACC76196.1 hypothetical protein Bphy_7196 [Paraburkholderia phymatum STM815]
MRRSASLLIMLLTTALIFMASAHAVIHRESDSAAPPVAPGPAASGMNTESSEVVNLLRKHGIDADSNKSRIILRWIQKIQRDPAIAESLQHGQHVGQIFLDPRAREEVMSNGLAHLTPSDRLQYVKLLTRFLDELVPVNCFGLDDMSAVMNHVSLREMSDADVDQYFGLLYKVLLSDVSDAPVPAPTPQQNAAAENQLTRMLIAELGGDQTSLERFAFYTSNPKQATPADVCWTTRVTLHAIIAMPDPERDLVLLRTMAPHKAQGAAPAPRLGTPATAIPPPASAAP